MKRLAVIVLVLAVAAGGLIVGRQWPSVPRSAAVAATGSGSAPSWLDRLGRMIGWHLPDRPARFSGYVEADYVLVTSSLGGTLMRLDVARGQNVAAGAPLFQLDDTAERAARDEAAERLRQAKAQLADLQTGRRAPEIEAIIAQRIQAEAAYRQSAANYERQAQLHRDNVSTQKQLDEAVAQRDHDRARIKELNAQLQVARMPGRDEAIKASEAAVGAAQAALANATWRLGQQTGTAPVDSLVVDTLYRPGETVAAGKPLVQLLPPANIKIRFFVPETDVARIAVGQTVQVTCDGCGVPMPASVRYISPRAEFTPPVIYSREQRSRLVFMIEARPTARPEALRVGQPVDVTPVQP